MGIEIIKIFSYDIESSPGFSDAKFMTQEELEKERHKKLLEERILKINKIRKNDNI
jgi:hypothetical protein